MVQGTRLMRTATMLHKAALSALIVAVILVDAAGWPMPTKGRRSRATSEITARQKRRAKRSFRRAMYWLHRKNYDRAISILQRAYETWKSPSFLYNLAVVYALKGDPVRSVEYLHQYRKARPEDDSRLPEPLQRALRQVGTLLVRAPGSDVDIYVDGTHKGAGRAEVVMRPGNAVVEMRRGRTVLKSKKVHLVAGRQTLWEVDQFAPPPRPRSRSSHRQPGVLSPGGTRRQDTRRGMGRLHWAYFTAAAATALIALSAAAGLSAKTKNVYQDFLDTDRTDANLAKTGNRYQNSANAMWAVAGTMTITAAVIALFTRWKKPKPTNEHLTIGPTGATLKLVW